ncbi:MAG: lipid-A-disaccharide synthase [Bacteroidetes bacterium]|nr:MAG: lipid-A-disaccharide synthase [Bacteroidota bacterium]
MKYYVIAGESSGDMHAANLIRSLRKRDPHAAFRAWGGDKMASAGAVIIKHIHDLAFMGFAEVAKHLGEILSNLSFCKKDILAFQPDVLILVDYPGFNLRIASFARKHGLKVFYYISPQVWAWKKNRIKKIKKTTDKMFVILPFEEIFYRSHGVSCFYGGHPLMDEVARFKQRAKEEAFSGDKPVVALLPGSRRQEIKKILPLMLSVVKVYPQYRFVLCGLSHYESLYASYLADYPEVTVVYETVYPVLSSAMAALVTSGTATLETAAFRVPQVVCYRSSLLTFLIARFLITIKYISLVNIILDRPVVKELIQRELNRSNLLDAFEELLPGTESRKEIVSSYAELHNLLGDAGASQRVADAMWNMLENKEHDEK